MFDIWNEFKSKNLIEKVLNPNYEIDELKQNHAELFFAFEIAPNTKIQKQLLSLVPEKYSKEIIMNAFGVSRYLVDASRKHAKESGIGMLLETKPIFRDRLDKNLIDGFLEFVTQDEYLQDVAYGDRTIKITKDISIVMPNVIRKASHTKIIDDYKLFYGEKSLSRSVCYKILDECSASFSKCLQGLDNMMADGMYAFENLEKTLNSLCNFLYDETEKIDSLISILKSNQNFLKFNYLKHLKYSSSCSDHCVNFALSNVNNCDHIHTRECSDCNALDYSLIEIQSEIEKILPDNQNKKDTIFNTKKEVEKIKEWKNHLVRSWAQDQIKYKTLNELDVNSIYIHADWAMKFEPIKFMEKQEEFFGKRGISWHITCIVFLKDQKLTSLTYVHLFESCSQDVDAVIAILDSVFRDIYKNFEKKNIFFRSDNAGCYHNKVLIPIIYFLAKKHNIVAKRYDFGESQTCKDICDRKISPIKKAIREYVNSGKDVLDANDMKHAIDSNINLTGVQTFLCKINDVSFKNDFKFPISISLYYSFVYENEELIAFKHYNIGTGLRLKYQSLCKLKLDNFTEKLNDFELDENNNDSSLDLNNVNPIHHEKTATSTFRCKKCDFITFDRNSLDEHLESHFENLKMNTYSKIKLKYIDMIKNVRTNKIENHSNYKSDNYTQFNNLNNLDQGFALKIIKRKPFTDDQKRFLQEKFEIGIKSRKLTPEAVAKEMASLYERFSEEERLKVSQIKRPLKGTQI